MTTAPRQNQAETAYAQIWGAILDGTLPEGSHLVETRLAEHLEMSRTPVREAIRRLEAEGLVVGEANKGATVRPITADDVRDLYDLRARLESYATALAAERRTEDDLTALTDLAYRFRLATRDVVGVDPVEPAHAEAVHACNAAFHARVLATSRHARLQQLLARAVDRPLVRRAFTVYDDDQLTTSARFHELIVEAIGRGEAERAERLAREHVLQARDILLADVATRGVQTPGAPD